MDYTNKQLYVLFELVKTSEYAFWTDECCQSVFNKICAENGVNIAFVNLKLTLPRLLSKIKMLISQAKKEAKKGGRHTKKLMEKFKSMTYKLSPLDSA